MLKAKLYVLKKQEEEEKRSGIRGEVKEIGWGQIRYVLTLCNHIQGKGSQNKSGDNRRWKSNGWLH